MCRLRGVPPVAAAALAAAVDATIPTARSRSRCKPCLSAAATQRSASRHTAPLHRLQPPMHTQPIRDVLPRPALRRQHQLS